MFDLVIFVFCLTFISLPFLEIIFAWRKTFKFWNLLHRIHHIDGKIKIRWLEQSYESFKLICIKLFLKSIPSLTRWMNLWWVMSDVYISMSQWKCWINVLTYLWTSLFSIHSSVVDKVFTIALKKPKNRPIETTNVQWFTSSRENTEMMTINKRKLCTLLLWDCML